MSYGDLIKVQQNIASGSILPMRPDSGKYWRVSGWWSDGPVSLVAYNPSTNLVIDLTPPQTVSEMDFRVSNANYYGLRNEDSSAHYIGFEAVEVGMAHEPQLLITSAQNGYAINIRPNAGNELILKNVHAALGSAYLQDVNAATGAGLKLNHLYVPPNGNYGGSLVNLNLKCTNADYIQFVNNYGSTQMLVANVAFTK